MAHKGRDFEYGFHRDLSADNPAGWFCWLPKYLWLVSGNLTFATFEYEPLVAGPSAAGVYDMDAGTVRWDMPEYTGTVGVCSFTVEWALTFDEHWMEMRTVLKRDADVSPTGVIPQPPLDNFNMLAGGIELNDWLEWFGPDPVFWLMQAAPWSAIPP